MLGNLLRRLRLLGFLFFCLLGKKDGFFDLRFQSRIGDCLGFVLMSLAK